MDRSVSDILSHELQKDDNSRHFVNFFFYLGRAVSQWAHVDRELFWIFRYALNAAKDETAAVVYLDHNSISDRLNLTDKIFAATLAKKYQPEWRAIAKEVVRLAPFRNRLAHEMVVNTGRVRILKSESEPGVLSLNPVEAETWWELNTDFHHTLTKPPKPAVRIDAIRNHHSDLIDYRGRWPPSPNTCPPARGNPLSNDLPHLRVPRTQRSKSLPIRKGVGATSDHLRLNFVSRVLTFV